MTETSLTLLERIGRQDAEDAWAQLTATYSPMLERWLHRYDLQAADADDLLQEVLLTVARELPNFQHNQRTGAFRSWLKQILVNRLRRHFQTKDRRPTPRGETDFLKQLGELEDPKSNLSRLWDHEHDRHLLLRLIELVEPRFNANTMRAFRRVVLDEVEPERVAQELNLTKNAVVIAKCRVLKELRREGQGLLGD